GSLVPPDRTSATEPELRDEVAVAPDVLTSQVIQQPGTPPDEHEHSAPARVVLRVHLEVFGQLRDPGAQDRDLHLGGAGVVRRTRVLLDDGALVVLGQGHGRTTRLPATMASRPGGPHPRASSGIRARVA